MFYPRELLVALGGFDHITFPRAVGEDTDLGWRARKSGARCVFAPEAGVQHAVLDTDLPQAVQRAWSWGLAVPLYKRHPELRRERLMYRVFWNWQHHSTGRAWLAIMLPGQRSMWPLKAWLARPWLADRARDPGSGSLSPRRAAWYALIDSVEMGSMLARSLRHRTLVL
jgi:GT2 family glycosyltransferase